ncbi:uncharacterized protein EI97DRAFT_71771 [Westerdykella ornata]|uniref:Uncharacterized protein n=1 Tax=Westerdykella ornata TaxID=318751 RepID=A0A6A6JJB1_WESOR|nr:uncharacterized protein EI97DRAFT_71771 [Westerdykella ornata]KAF2275766.1 hypothetical protein EI97DRAFT_71771 [Westerdykella ornata]
MGSRKPIPEIDLTSSSPEPESSRQPVQRFKTERVEGRSTPVTSKLPIRSATVKTEASAAPDSTPQRLIHPVHLERLIDTTDRDAIKSVLLQLCALSPAFSGALARGLAPHSRFAQGLETQGGSVRPHANLASSITPSPRPLSERIPTPHNSKASNLLRQRIKDEHGSSPSTSNLPRGFPESPVFAPLRKPTPTGTPRLAFIKWESASASSSSSRTPSIQRTPISPSNTARKSSSGAILECDNCALFYFEDSSDMCLFHPGRLKPVEDGNGSQTWVYTCCKGGSSAAPCKEGKHVSKANDDDVDSLKRARRPSGASPMRHGKSPRLL